MVQPSSLPLWPRRVEWLRAHHGNWLVDGVEGYYYSWKAPDPGGPQLKHLPTVGVATPSVQPAAHFRAVSYAPPPVPSPFVHTLRGEGVWRRPGLRRGGPPPPPRPGLPAPLSATRLPRHVAP